jgi:hypothetical protein
MCAQETALSPFVTPSIDMNNSPTTMSPTVYCGGTHSSWSCVSPINYPQSALVRTDNTCTANVTIYTEADICNNLVTDMSAADCNGLIALYNSAGGASWTNKTNWLFN